MNAEAKALDFVTHSNNASLVTKVPTVQKIEAICRLLLISDSVFGFDITERLNLQACG